MNEVKNMITDTGNKSFYISVLFALILVPTGYAQGQLADYRRSVAIDTLFANKVYHAPDDFSWSSEHLVWYDTQTREGRRYFLVQPDKKLKREAFDHTRLAQSLSGLLNKEISGDSLRIRDLEFQEDLSSFSFRADSLRISASLDDYDLEIVDTIKREDRRRGYWGSRGEERSGDPVSSPDGRFSAFIKNSNVYLRNNQTESEYPLSYDGSEGFYYASNLRWSPDSKKLMAYKVRPGQEHKIYFVESSPEDQLQPRLQSRDYLKPGDQLDFRSPQLFLIEEREHIKIPTDLFNHQYSLSNFQWKENSSAFTFEYNERGHQNYKVLQVDAEDGKITTLISESSPTFIDYSGKKYRYDTQDGKEIIWASERDGWNHLYLFDASTGALKHQITSGDWPVREVLEVDEENRQIYFTASGLDPDQDPYFIHYFRVDFDGSNLTRFTTENGDHQVTFSPDRKYYIDQYSRVDMPPVTLLKKTSNQKQLMELERADIKDLLATGWQTPEPFKAKGRDGKTDIWGMILRPSNFDPAKSYPIIEYIYAGPHSSFVPKDFGTYYYGMSSLAELGFIVVQIDGMGTSNRSKAFHDVAWKNLKDAGFPDRKLWIKAAARKYPYMNTEKVGIHGRSAGGQSSAGALIFHPDFYDVAVSSAGCHDNRMDKIWWNEQWMGYPIGPHYAESSNTVNAAQLEGDLMLIVGELDDNVDPASTFQFADALIKANKDFELVVRPGMGHSAGNHEYAQRKRKDFFVQHLMGVTPPEWNEVYRSDRAGEQQ